MHIFICSSGSSVQRRFVRRMWLSALFCVLFSLTAAVFFRLVHHPAVYFAWPLAALPAVPILGALMATGAYLKEETDEFQRDLLVQGLLYASGLTLAVVTASGYLHDFARVPVLPLIWIYPLFWCVAGISIVVLSRRYR
jgi:hypothetical protein